LQQISDIENIKEQIRSLISQLPVMQSGQEEAALLSFELQEELRNVLIKKPKDLKKKLESIEQRQKGLDALIKMGDQFKNVFATLSEGGKEVLQIRGQGIRNNIRKQNENRNTGQNHRRVHEGSGQGT
jgi:hypothetical protein